MAAAQSRPRRSRAGSVLLLLAFLAGGVLLLPSAVSARPDSGPTQRPFLADGTATTTTALAETVANGFQDSVVFSGLTQPTAVRFSPDGRVFVAQRVLYTVLVVTLSPLKIL